MAAETGAGLSFRDYGVPLYTVPRHQPCAQVRLDNPNAQLRAVFAAVPVPPDARPAAGTDGHLALWQPSTDRYWEFFRMRREADGWHARYGGRIVGLSKSPGHFQRLRGARGQVLEQPWWGATATGLPLIGGLITSDEVRRGRIDHALAIAVPRVRRGVMAVPAQRSDGRYEGPYSLPEGARFRLDPLVDVAALPVPPLVRMIAAGCPALWDGHPGRRRPRRRIRPGGPPGADRPVRPAARWCPAVRGVAGLPLGPDAAAEDASGS